MLDDDEAEDRPTFPDDPSVQHGHLARLLARLKETVAAGAEAGEVCQALAVLVADVRQHFDSEEYSMDRAEYPLRDEHRERHAKFLHHLESVRAECGKEERGLAPAVAEQLENWFFDHEQTADAELLSYLRSSRRASLDP